MAPCAESTPQHLCTALVSQHVANNRQIQLVCVRYVSNKAWADTLTCDSQSWLPKLKTASTLQQTGRQVV